ncbi:MAG: hypothetical protein N2645_06095 [Clostridia bacterium]|nr:hypothetical protein [Clostridia bacterium]
MIKGMKKPQKGLDFASHAFSGKILSKYSMRKMGYFKLFPLVYKWYPRWRSHLKPEFLKSSDKAGTRIYLTNNRMDVLKIREEYHLEKVVEFRSVEAPLMERGGEKTVFLKSPAGGELKKSAAYILNRAHTVLLPGVAAWEKQFYHGDRGHDLRTPLYKAGIQGLIVESIKANVKRLLRAGEKLIWNSNGQNTGKNNESNFGKKLPDTLFTAVGGTSVNQATLVGLGKTLGINLKMAVQRLDASILPGQAPMIEDQRITPIKSETFFFQRMLHAFFISKVISGDFSKGTSEFTHSHKKGCLLSLPLWKSLEQHRGKLQKREWESNVLIDGFLEISRLWYRQESILFKSLAFALKKERGAKESMRILFMKDWKAAKRLGAPYPSFTVKLKPTTSLLSSWKKIRCRLSDNRITEIVKIFFKVHKEKGEKIDRKKVFLQQIGINHWLGQELRVWKREILYQGSLTRLFCKFMARVKEKGENLFYRLIRWKMEEMRLEAIYGTVRKYAGTGKYKAGYGKSNAAWAKDGLTSCVILPGFLKRQISEWAGEAGLVQSLKESQKENMEALRCLYRKSHLYLWEKDSIARVLYRWVKGVKILRESVKSKEPERKDQNIHFGWKSRDRFGGKKLARSLIEKLLSLWKYEKQHGEPVKIKGREHTAAVVNLTWKREVTKECGAGYINSYIAGFWNTFGRFEDIKYTKLLEKLQRNIKLIIGKPVNTMIGNGKLGDVLKRNVNKAQSSGGHLKDWEKHDIRTTKTDFLALNLRTIRAAGKEAYGGYQDSPCPKSSQRSPDGVLWRTESLKHADPGEAYENIACPADIEHKRNEINALKVLFNNELRKLRTEYVKEEPEGHRQGSLELSRTEIEQIANRVYHAFLKKVRIEHIRQGIFR